ncbi:MAG TPA: serine/threonine-protein kinase, partial [Polyangia bacterium]
MACKLEPGTIVGEYRIEEKIGEGGMATIYGATHPLLGKQAAIKVMSPALSADAAAVARFALEARAVSRIGHPNIVDVFGFGRLPDGRSYFVMERLHGETLYDRLWKQQGPLPLPEVLDILAQICDALEAAHEKGIIHRDLKPDNVFIVADPETPGGERCKVLDFGIAKVLAGGHDAPRTRTDVVMGTPAYMAPEQCRRAADVDEKVDVYALGVILFQAVAGRAPFLAADPVSLMYQ